MRTCSICKTEKNSADFKLKTNGCLSSFCVTCSALYQKEYQEKMLKMNCNYYVIRSLDEFILKIKPIIDEYLKQYYEKNV